MEQLLTFKNTLRRLFKKIILLKTPNNVAKRAIKLFHDGNTGKAFAMIIDGMLESPKSLHLKDAFASIGRESGLHEEALGAVRAAIAIRERKIIKAGCLAGSIKKLNVKERIFLSGYFYSGSGAIMDYLRGFEGCKKWPNSPGEMRLIKFPGGIADLATRLQKNKMLKSADLVDFYLHLVGKKIIFSEASKYDMWEVVNKNSRSILRDEKSQAYLYEGYQLFRQFNYFFLSTEQNLEEFTELARDGVQKMLDAAANQINARRLLVDQIITAWRLPIAEFAPPSSFIVVHRDPRDQYTEAKEVWANTGRKVFTADKFAKMYRKRRQIVDDNIPLLEGKYRHRFLKMAFEDFVLNHNNAAEKILEFIVLPYENLKEQKFFPEVSRKNVGKYLTDLPEEDRITIETELPEFLYPEPCL